MSFLRVGPWAVVASAVLSMSCGSGGSDPGGSGAGSSGTGSAATAGIDGTWDITEAGGGDIGPSQMTIGGGVVTGVISGSDEGKSSGGCKTLKDRGEFKLTFEGNALSGTITKVREYEGSETDCPANRNETTTISGTRVSGTAGSGLTGEWEVQAGDRAPFIVNVDGLTAKAWDKKAKADGKEATVNVAVAGGSATVTSQRHEFSFAARRR